MNNCSQFLSAMRERYGVSEEFVSAGRPLVDAIYAEFDGDRRASLLEFAETVFSQQAATEQSIRATASLLTEATDKLERAFADLSRVLVKLARPVAKRSVIARSVVERSAVPRWQLN
jgi:hypothetical protein